MEAGKIAEAMDAIRKAKELGMPVPENLPSTSEAMARLPDDPIIQKLGRLVKRLEKISDRIDSGDMTIPESIEERWMLESTLMSRFYPERIEEVRPIVSQLKNSSEAELLLDKIKNKIEDAESHGLLGKILVIGGHSDAAVRFLLMATKHDTDNFVHWVWLCHAYLEIKRSDLAADALMASKSRGLTEEYEEEMERELGLK